MFGATKVNYREAAVRYLNTGAKSVKQVKDYLVKREATAEDVASTVEFLKELGYLDDVKYSAGVFQREYEKGRGKMRTERYLLSKGVSAEDIKEGYFIFLDEFEGQYDEKSIALKEGRKVANGQPFDEKLKGKIARRLAGKGFSSHVIYSVIDALQRESEENESVR